MQRSRASFTINTRHLRFLAYRQTGNWDDTPLILDPHHGIPSSPGSKNIIAPGQIRLANNEVDDLRQRWQASCAANVDIIGKKGMKSLPKIKDYTALLENTHGWAKGKSVLATRLRSAPTVQTLTNICLIGNGFWNAIPGVGGQVCWRILFFFIMKDDANGTSHSHTILKIIDGVGTVVVKLVEGYNRHAPNKATISMSADFLSGFDKSLANAFSVWKKGVEPDPEAVSLALQEWLNLLCAKLEQSHSQVVE
ncbi:MAG: hypothetical protein Q9218_002562 [Villophora microphyllina]